MERPSKNRLQTCCPVGEAEPRSAWYNVAMLWANDAVRHRLRGFRLGFIAERVALLLNEGLASACCSSKSHIDLTAWLLLMSNERCISATSIWMNSTWTERRWVHVSSAWEFAVFRVRVFIVSDHKQRDSTAAGKATTDKGLYFKAKRWAAKARLVGNRTVNLKFYWSLWSHTDTEPVCHCSGRLCGSEKNTKTQNMSLIF